MEPLSICFPENHNMYSPKALLYIVLIVQVYTVFKAKNSSTFPKRILVTVINAANSYIAIPKAPPLLVIIGEILTASNSGITPAFRFE
jgi:hypothetical protein